jgi:hypothetical protein
MCFIGAGAALTVLSGWFWRPISLQHGLAVVLVATWLLGEFEPKEAMWRWGVGSLAALAVGWLITVVA